MKIDLMAVLVMIIAIAVGQFIGGYLMPYLGGLGGGILGSFIVGLIIYGIYALATKTKLTITGGVIFSILIYVANLIAGYAGTLIGITSGYMTLIIAGLVAALLWGWVGGKNAKSGKLKTPKL